MRRIRRYQMTAPSLSTLLLFVVSVVLIALSLGLATREALGLPEVLVSQGVQGEYCRAVRTFGKDGREEYRPCSWLRQYNGSYRRIHVAPSWKPPQALRPERSA